MNDASNDDASNDDASNDDASNDDASNDDASNDDASNDDAQPDDLREASWPPASISGLVSLCASQALLGLGMAPSPGQATPELNLPMARYFVDLLAVLAEKTSGNLEPAQREAIESTLHDLRMACVRQSSAVPAASTAPDSATPAEPLDDSDTSAPRSPAAADDPPPADGEK
jgi:hypothetical protein